jgi:hypothetical protein
MIFLQFAQDPGSLGSLLIRWFDHGQWSHVDTVMPDGSLLGARNDVIDGIPAGVQIRPVTYLGTNPRFKVGIPADTVQTQAYYAFVQSQIGKPYDQTAIAAFVAGRDWNDTSAWFCSELCAAGLEAAKVVYPLAAPVNKVAPDDLLLVCSVLVNIDQP